MLSNSRAEFILSGTRLTPPEITNMLEITPSRVWLIGDYIQKTKLRRKHNGWCFSSAEEDLELAIKLVISVLNSKSDKIQQICEKYEMLAELSCVVYLIDEVPPLHFDEEIIQGLALLGTQLDIDIIWKPR